MAFQPSSLFLLCFLAFILLLPSCQRPSLPKERALTDYFRLQVLTDTLLVEISEETEVPEAGDTIPNALFFSVIPPTLLQEIDYLADSAGAVVLGRQHFPLESDVEAYWVEIRQFWFKHHSLLVYDKTHKIFTDRITIAEWYGGDGGQVLIGSWLFDLDGDGKKDIVRREIQHSMVLEGEEPQEHIEESAAVLLWKNGNFVDAPVQDTAAMIRRFPIRSFW